MWTRAGLAALMCAALACDKQGDEPFDDTPLTPELAAGSVVDTVRIEVEPYKRGCSLLEPSTCLIAEDSAETDFHDYRHVWGLDYEWGHRYVLDVNIVEMPEDTVDGDGFVWNYELVERVEASVELEGTFTLPAETFVVSAGQGGGELIDATPFVCETQLLCSLLSDTLGDAQVRVGFGAEVGDPLVALELL